MKTLSIPEVKNPDKYWFGINPALTHFMSSLSCLFPEGERFFMKSMNAYRDELPEYLKQELKEFCQQEANHGRVHTKLNTVLDELHNSTLISRLDKNTGRVIKFWTKFLSKKQKLAVTCCLEHLTALMGHQLLERYDLIDMMKGEARDVWLYHAQEEVEHAHVSYDIYKAIGGSYLLRTGLMIPITIILLTVIVYNWKRLMREDKFGADGSLKAIELLFGHDGFIRNMKSGYFAWFKYDYHPSRLQNKTLGN